MKKIIDYLLGREETATNTMYIVDMNENEVVEAIEAVDSAFSTLYAGI